MASWTEGGTKAEGATSAAAEPECVPPEYGSLDQLLSDRNRIRGRLFAPRSYAQRDPDEFQAEALDDEIRSWLASFDVELSTNLPQLQKELGRLLAARSDAKVQMEVLSLNATDLGSGPLTPRYLHARVKVRREEVNLGAYSPNGEPYHSEAGLVPEDPISDAIAIVGGLGLLRALAARLVRGIALRLARRAGRLTPRGRLFGKPSMTGDPSLRAGEGWTDKFGNVTYSTAGSATDQALVKHHELVHSFLSPKLNVLRNLRADFGHFAYNHSHLIRYVEEALAETYAQLRVHGLKGLPEGIMFPIANGYVSVSRVLGEGLIGTFTVGSAAYGIHLLVNGDGK
jgi:hypothetical protein